MTLCNGHYTNKFRQYIFVEKGIVFFVYATQEIRLETVNRCKYAISYKDIQ